MNQFLLALAVTCYVIAAPVFAAPSTIPSEGAASEGVDTPWAERHAAEKRVAEKTWRLTAQQLAFERQVAAAKLELELRQLDREQYLKGKSSQDLSALEDAILIAEKRHEQAVQRLTSSEQLANQGLISQASLELEAASEQRTKAELQMAREQLRVYRETTYERRVLEYGAAADAAAAKLGLLRSQVASELRLLTAQLNAAKLALAELDTTDETRVVVCGDVPFEHDQAILVTSRAQLEQATAEHNAQRIYFRDEMARTQKLVEAVSLELAEFLRGQSKQRLHEQRTAIRTISESLDAAQQQLAWSQRVTRKGYVTPAELEADRIRVIEHQIALKAAQHAFTVLERHELVKTEAALRARLEAAKREHSHVAQLKTATLKKTAAAVARHRQAYEFVGGGSRSSEERGSASVAGGE